MSGPRPELRARILAQAGARPAPTRAGLARRRAFAAVGSVAWLAIVSSFGHVRPAAAGAVMLVVWAALALGFGVYFARVRGARVARSPFALGALTPIGAVLVLAATTVLGAWLGHSTDHHSGVIECAVLSIACSLGPLALALYVERRSDPIAPAASGAALGAVAGALGGVAMSFICARTETAHVLVGHVTGFVAVAIVAALVGRRVLALR